MNEVVCPVCHAYLDNMPIVCPACTHPLVYTGDERNVIISFKPNLLIHRYRGSDLLEMAVLIKEGRTNCKVATQLREYARPLTVKKSEVYTLDKTLLAAIESLRQERYDTMQQYDKKMADYWHRLTPYYDEASYEPYGADDNSSPAVTNE